MNDEQFAEFWAEHPDLSFEMSADGETLCNASKLYADGSAEQPDQFAVVHLGDGSGNGNYM